MSRRLKPLAKTFAKTSTGPRGPVVERLPVPARPLVTDPCDGSVKHPTISGAIVRLRPAEGVTEEQVEAVRARWVGMAAVRVFVEPRRKPAVVPNDIHAKRRNARSSARAVVLEMVAESNSSDPAALAEIVERILSEENL